MNLVDARLAPTIGADGLVARTRGAVLFVAARTPVEEVGRLVAAVSSHEEPTPGHNLARQMATVVGADQGTLPGFALVASSAGGTYIKVYGPVEVRVESTEGSEQVISGVGSLTGVDRELTGTFHTIVAHRAGDPVPAPVFDVDVRAGTTPGDGFSLTTLTGPTDAPTPSVPPSSVPADDTNGSPAPGTSPDYEAATQAAMAPPVAEEPTVAPMAEEPSTWEPPAADPPPAQEAPAPEPAWEAPIAEPPPSAAEPDDALASPPVFDAPAAEPVGPPPAAEPPWSEPSTDGAPVVDAAFAPPAEHDHAAHDHAAHEPATLPPTAIPGGGFTSHLLGALDEDEAEEREPLPVELDPADVRAPDDEGTPEIMVQGVLCSRGHFNDPRSRFCSSCGIGMVQNTQVLAPGPRPPLGVLVFEDGATFSLAQDYVVGRQPDVSDLVRDGLALPLPVDDPERSISRAHAELRLVDWDVHLINLSATNGSFVWDENQQQWIPIPTGQSVVLAAGMRIALGRRSAVFESSLVR